MTDDFIDTDASDTGLGAVLSQKQDGIEKDIAYYSHTWKCPERSYCVTRRELLAIIDSMAHFQYFLYGRPFSRLEAWPSQRLETKWWGFKIIVHAGRISHRNFGRKFSTKDEQHLQEADRFLQESITLERTNKWNQHPQHPNNKNELKTVPRTNQPPNRQQFGWKSSNWVLNCLKVAPLQTSRKTRS